MSDTPLKLPVKPLARDTVMIEGQPVELRGLSRAEALKLKTHYSVETADDAEVFVVMCGTGASKQEATDFLANNDVNTAGLVIDKIIELSGITEGSDPKP